MRVLIALELRALSQLRVLVSQELADAFQQVAILIGYVALSYQKVDLLGLLKLILASITFIGSRLYLSEWRVNNKNDSREMILKQNL